jgi:hypothetical protein
VGVIPWIKNYTNERVEVFSKMMMDRTAPIVHQRTMTTDELEEHNDKMGERDLKQRLIIRFPEADICVPYQNGTNYVITGRACKFTIDVYPSAFRLLRTSLVDLEISEGMRTAYVLDGLPKLLIHELFHYVTNGIYSCLLAGVTLSGRLTRISKADDVKLDENDLPTWFHDHFPWVSPLAETGKYVADNLDLCRGLAQSQWHKAALRNAESLVALSVICWLLVHRPQWDLTGSTVKKRDSVPYWVKGFWEFLHRCGKLPCKRHPGLNDRDPETDDDEAAFACEVSSLESEEDNSEETDSDEYEPE